MAYSSWLLCLWPGLARLWTRGEWPSLIFAVAFGILLNLALISSLRWPELLGAGFPTLIWPILTGIWVVSALVARHELKILNARRNSAEEAAAVPDTLFIQAQREYLKRNWDAAETMLRRRLQFRPRDAEARLLLATIYRRRQRWAEATEELDTLQRFDESEGWQFEIAAERAAIVARQADVPESVSAQELHSEAETFPLPTEPTPSEQSQQQQQRAA